MKEASESDIKKHEKEESGTGFLCVGLGFGLICVIVGIVAIAGMEEHQFSRSSRQGMSEILRFFGGLLGTSGGVVCIIIGILAAVGGIAAFIRSRVRSSYCW